MIEMNNEKKGGKGEKVTKGEENGTRVWYHAANDWNVLGTTSGAVVGSNLHKVSPEIAVLDFVMCKSW